MIRVFTLLLSIALVVPIAVSQKKTQSFWDRVVKFLGVSSTPGGMKDGLPDRIGNGDIWIYNVETRVGVELKSGNFRSPIFLSDNQTVLALMEERVVSFPVSGGPITDVATVPGIQKLVGVEDDTPGQVLILSDLDRDNCPVVGVLTLSSATVTNLPNGGLEDDLKLVSHLRSWDREYDGGDTRFEVKIKTKQNGTVKEWTDVMLRQKNKGEVNVSRCPAGVNCGQPAISPDRGSVVFVRAR